MTQHTRPGLDPRVTYLGALVPDGTPTGRLYPPTGFTADAQTDRHRAVEHIFRMAMHCGMVGPHADDDYAVLDCADDSGDIVEEWGIRDRRGFRFLYRKLGWRLGAAPPVGVDAVTVFQLLSDAEVEEMDARTVAWRLVGECAE